MTHSIRYGDIEQAASQIDRVRDDVLQQLTALLGRIQSLQDGAFRTELAAPAFQERYRQLSDSVKNAAEALAGMSAYLRTVVRTAQDMDRALREQI
ncbi:MAG: WXG100 family type VII secretion target [Dactylosporangium sp.]|jgi:Proteins of 100 residues with WXG.|nr:WXG100 family type VII secretion target [Dactylosporangium sp.]